MTIRNVDGILNQLVTNNLSQSTRTFSPGTVEQADLGAEGAATGRHLDEILAGRQSLNTVDAVVRVSAAKSGKGAEGSANISREKSLEGAGSTKILADRRGANSGPVLTPAGSGTRAQGILGLNDKKFPQLPKGEPGVQDSLHTTVTGRNQSSPSALSGRLIDLVI